MFKFHSPFLKSKWSLVFRSCLVETSESQMRKLLEFAEWLRKVSCLLIHLTWQKTQRRETVFLQRGCPAVGIRGPPVALALPISYTVNESLALVSPKTKGILTFRMMRWNWHLHGDGPSTEAMTFQPNMLLLLSSLAQRGQPTHHSLPNSSGQTHGRCPWHFCCSPSNSHLVLLILLLNIYSPLPWSKSNRPLPLTYCNVLILQPPFDILYFALHMQASTVFHVNFIKNNLYKKMYSVKVESQQIYTPV